jgi:2-oxoglutarate dehydrogenase E1 component
MDLHSLVESGFANIELIEEQYEKYLQDPRSVDQTWHQLFENVNDTPAKIVVAETPKPMKFPVIKEAVSDSQEMAPSDIRVYNLIEAYRAYGHLMANINPINTHPVEEPIELKLETHGLQNQDLTKLFPTFGLLSDKTAPLLKIISTLKSIYCNKIGVEYVGLGQPELEQWLQNRIEPTHFKINLTIDQKQMILHQLSKSELLEVFLHTKYVGQKRFSLEGGETLIPMLSAVIETGAQLGLEVFEVGMAHRGRLNVLSNILNKSYSELFTEFDEAYIPDSYEGSGDVKYHKGFSSEFETHGSKIVKIDLIPNPSHLEAVDPVLEGQVKAKQISFSDENQERIIPILIHGDAAIAGQGVVYETLQFSKLDGYSTGGTIHFIINNQIGFTTLPQDARSTFYCTDIAKTFGAPVFHVNAEDPEGCVYATNLALELRQKFHCDVFIDLYCYRKYGHNEADEPAFTQPLEYQLIRKKKPVREIYREELIHQGVLEKYMAETMEEEFKKALQQALTSIKINEKKGNGKSNLDLSQDVAEEGVFKPFETGVSSKILQEAAARFCAVPPNFNIHPKLAHLMKDRLLMVSDEAPVKKIDWGMGEMLAYASLLWEGTHVRISGQDCCRGTFSHRHAILMDQIEEKEYFPLKHLKEGQGRFDIINSPLSEYGILGFELGYSLGNPEALVIWEAQFGDFANGGQLIIDQFLVSGEQKWAQKSGLVLYLPHGYEGQGPDHSTGRIERFLQLAGHDNIRVVNPSTPAQLFHLLRRQVLNPIRKPLIIFTPKGLLRYPDCTNNIEDFTKGSFQQILDDPSNPSSVKKLIFCSGRIYYDLMAARAKTKSKEMAFIRVEQLYPFDINKTMELLKKYKEFDECIWLQEEPANMGAWDYVRPLLQPLLPSGKELKYVGRSRSATTAVGSHALHKREHNEIMNAVIKDYEIRVPGNDAGLKS